MRIKGTELLKQERTGRSPLMAEDMFSAVIKFLKSSYDGFESLLEHLDYYQCSGFYSENPVYSLPDDYPTVRADISAGGCEGIYLDWYLLYPGKKVVRIGTFKTLKESLEAYGIMGQISGVLICASDLYLMLNDKELVPYPAKQGGK